MNKNLKMTIAGITICTSLVNGGASFAQSEARCQETYDAWVIASSLNIRPTASTKYAPIGSLFRGEQVKIIGPEVGGWVKIAFGRNLTKVGYVSGNYLTNVKPNTNDKSMKKEMYVNVNNLNMRRIASATGSILGKLHKGYKVEIDMTTPEVMRDGFVWVKCKAIIKPNGEKIMRGFTVAKKYLSEQSVVTNTPVVKPEVAPEVKPETKPEVTPEVKPETKPEVAPEVKPEVTPEVKPETKPEVEKPQVQLAPVVTEESVTIVADGDVVDAEGNVLLTLKKGDKVTLIGEKHGVDTSKIELNNGSFGIIKNTMIDADFHTHDDFVFGRPCNSSNLGQSMDLVEYETIRDIDVFNSDCKYHSTSIVIPKGSTIHVARDFYNPETGNVEIAYKFIDANQNLIQGQGFVPAYQFR